MAVGAGLADRQVTVVGLGLMGGSLAAALVGRRACAAVIGVARRAEMAQEALARGYVDRASNDLAQGLRDADLVVLAAPVRAILSLLPRVGQAAKPGAVVLDLGSTKRAVCQTMAALPPALQPVGGHPMCGRERSGLQAAQPELYQGAPFVLCPLERTAPWALALAEELAEAVGARPLRLAADRHDRLVGAVSHLPYLLACGLVHQVMAVGQQDALAWEVAASGFRDASRLATSDETMMLDILLTNRDAVLEMVRGAVGHLEAAAALLERGQEEALAQALAGAAEARRGWRP
ncbi:MAG: prephenate dehydrogenase [Chloroflexi bacterium]|nr:prephenate dehydrogenase [Chloroflexota bacterium]